MKRRGFVLALLRIIGIFMGLMLCVKIPSPETQNFNSLFSSSVVYFLVLFVDYAFRLLKEHPYERLVGGIGVTVKTLLLMIYFGGLIDIFTLSYDDKLKGFLFVNGEGYYLLSRPILLTTIFKWTLYATMVPAILELFCPFISKNRSSSTVTVGANSSINS